MGSSKRRLFAAIDANAIIHRAYHAYPDTLVTSDGVLVNAVYGFTSMLLTILEDYKPHYIACAFDTAKPTFRHTEFIEYKAHRKPTDQALIDQFALVENVLQAFNIPILKKPGFEADDILGTLAAYVDEGKWQDYQLEMQIFTGDKDLLQLVSDTVHVVLPQGSFKTLTAFDRESTYERYGFYPEQVIDYKAVVGDPSDNIPGIKGLGDKGMKDLLNAYGNLDTIYKNLANLPTRQANLFREGVEQAELSRMLATIKRDVDISIDLEDTTLTDYSRADVLTLFQEYEFKSLVDKLPKSDAQSDAGEADLAPGQMGLFTTNDIDEDKESLYQVDVGGIPATDAEVSMALYLDPDEFDLSALKSPAIAFVSGEKVYVRSMEDVTDDEAGVVWAKDVVVYGYKLLLDCLKFEDKGRDDNDRSIIDIQAAYHIVNAGKKSLRLSDLLYDLVGLKINEPESIDKLGIIVETVVKAMDVLAERAKELKPDNSIIEALGTEDPYELIGEIEIPNIAILYQMEQRGVQVDITGLETLELELQERLQELENGVYDDLGHEFNLNSPKQLAEVLYDEIGIPEGRGKNKRTTKESLLKTYKDAHPMIPRVLEYRELSKLLGTYVSPFIAYASESQEKKSRATINTTFNFYGTSSGRLSSSDPNLQNLPIGTELADKFRKLIVPADGMRFVAIDYSQVEFRVMAHVSGDEALIDDFENDRDIHLQTASRLFDKPGDEISSQERKFGKTVNFGILYGQTKYGLSRMLGISRGEAADYINRYFKNYSGVRDYIDKSERVAIEKGFVESLSGRRRYIGGLSSSNQRIKEGALREAINMPIQGGAADIMRIAMLDCYRRITSSYSGKAFMLLQIHDELLFEVDAGIDQQFADDMQGLMESAVKLKVPLKTSVGVGNNLSEIK